MNDNTLTEEFLLFIEKSNIGINPIADSCLFFTDIFKSNEEKEYVKNIIYKSLENDKKYNEEFFNSWKRLNRLNPNNQLSLKKEFPKYLSYLDLLFGISNINNMKYTKIMVKDLPESICRNNTPEL